MRHWAWLVPVAAIALLVVAIGAGVGPVLAVTFLGSSVTLGTGRTTMMQGAVHLVLFAAFLFLALVP